MGNSDKELKAASREFGGHPLALTLLASFLKETQNGDVRRRDHIRGLLADADNPRHDQARRVMESYEVAGLPRSSDSPSPSSIASVCPTARRAATASRRCAPKPAIPGLTDALIDLDGVGNGVMRVGRLREVRLLSPVDPSDPEALDAHPLVREWFGARLKATNEAAWKDAHSRLYDHLRDTTQEGQVLDAGRSGTALPRHRPRLPRRALSRGSGRGLSEPNLSPATGRQI